MIWYVMDADYDSSWVTAVYESEELANEHVRRSGGTVYSETVLSEVTVEDRSAQRAAEAETSRAAFLEHREREERAHQRTLELVIDPSHRQKLCHCSVFSGSDGYFITPNGYCRYCGGWEPTVFRKHMGEPAFAEAISELDLHYRTRMREMYPAQVGSGTSSLSEAGAPNAQERSALENSHMGRDLSDQSGADPIKEP